MQDFAEGFYKSKAWQRCRNNYARARRGLCERCLDQGRYTPGAIVHHKIHLTPDNINDPTVTLNPDNLQLLCRDCHGETHRTKQTRYTVLPNGRILIK